MFGMENADGAWGGPVGEKVAKALEQGYSLPQGQPQPYHGYYFKVLKGKVLQREWAKWIL